MHIKKLQLHKFKKFKDTCIELKEGLSLVVGGNNSGKSSILQALATWQFCKTLLEIEKTRKSWVSTEKLQGIGMGIVDFTPMHIPSLAHLWTNLKSQKTSETDGYTLKINVIWDNDQGEEKNLEIGLSLANDRLFVKTTSTSISLNEVVDEKYLPIEGNVPNIAYLPPFAGVTDRESRLMPAMRGRLIGQGLSGGVIRNVLFDLHEYNRNERIKLKAGKKKIKNLDLNALRKNDSWEILSKTMQEIFGTDLKIVPFNERYHSYLKVESVKGEVYNGKFKKFPKYNARDLMVEGSGFLQWVSVYALALSPEYDVVLLDEPDAHLHPLLQQQLVDCLGDVSEKKNKQILLATHSTELIRSYDHEKILCLNKGKGKYLLGSEDKVKVLSGIGAVHTPTFHSLIQHKKMLILEAKSDERFLKILAERAGYEWPENLVSWYWTGPVKERSKLFRLLKMEIKELQAISIRDRDDEPDNSVDSDLIDKSMKDPPDGFYPLKWRRRHIENYLLCLAAIARAANKSKEEVKLFVGDNHGLALPDNTSPSEVLPAIRDARGKEIMTEGEMSMKAAYKISREDIARGLEKNEIAEDIRMLFRYIDKICHG